MTAGSPPPALRPSPWQCWRGATHWHWGITPTTLLLVSACLYLCSCGNQKFRRLNNQQSRRPQNQLPGIITPSRPRRHHSGGMLIRAAGALACLSVLPWGKASSCPRGNPCCRSETAATAKGHSSPASYRFRPPLVLLLNFFVLLLQEPNRTCWRSALPGNRQQGMRRGCGPTSPVSRCWTWKQQVCESDCARSEWVHTHAVHLRCVFGTSGLRSIPSRPCSSHSRRRQAELFAYPC